MRPQPPDERFRIGQIQAAALRSLASAIEWNCESGCSGTPLHRAISLQRTGRVPGPPDARTGFSTRA